jgi:hypothetical protein
LTHNKAVQRREDPDRQLAVAVLRFAWTTRCRTVCAAPPIARSPPTSRGR